MRGVNIMLNKLRVSRIARSWQYLFCCTITFLLLSGSAWSADANKLLDVSIDSAAATPTVLIKTAEPVGYRYTVYDSFEPTRVVVDFPGMEMSDVAESLNVDLSSVQEIRVAGFALSSGQLTRVEILLAKNTEYQVNLDGKEFRVAFSADANAPEPMVAKADPVQSAKVATPDPVMSTVVDATQVATLLQGVKVSSGQAILSANGKLDKFQYFALSNPARLVVDVYGLKPGFKERSFAAEDGFKGVRVGTYNDKTRFVFDASMSDLPGHVVEGRSTDILVSWGAGKSTAVAAAPAAKEKVVETVKPVVSPVAVKKTLKTAPVQSSGRGNYIG